MDSDGRVRCVWSARVIEGIASSYCTYLTMTEVSIYINHKGLSWSERISKVKFKKRLETCPKSVPANALAAKINSCHGKTWPSNVSSHLEARSRDEPTTWIQAWWKKDNDKGNCWHLAALTFSEVRKVGLWQIPKLVCSFCLSKKTQGTGARTTRQRQSHLMQRQMLEGEKYKS